MFHYISPPIRSYAEKQEWSLKYVLKFTTLVSLIVAIVTLYFFYSTELGGQALVQLLNNKSSQWTASLNNISGRSRCWSGEVLKARRSSKLETSLYRLPSISVMVNPNIPTSYDFRDKHPSCKNLQANNNCSTSWVDIVASAASDRLCVASEASIQAWLWAPEVAACCTLCQGPLHAWLYLNARGLAENNQNVSCGRNSLLKGCSGQCQNHTSQHRHYGTSAFLLAQSVESIQLEMMRNGPVVAILDVFSDFYYYSSGVYQYKYGSYQGSMAVKLIGWGRQLGIEFWLAVTSLGDHWGDRGVLKIKRGTNECKVEADVTAGHMLPR